VQGQRPRTNPNAALRAAQALTKTTGVVGTATAGADGECHLGARLAATPLTLLRCPCGKQPRRAHVLQAVRGQRAACQPVRS